MARDWCGRRWLYSCRQASRLEAWVETLMRTLAGLGLEAQLCELDEARGAHGEEVRGIGCS